MLETSTLDFSRYGETLFEVLFAGGRMAAGGSLEEGSAPRLKVNVRPPCYPELPPPASSLRPPAAPRLTLDHGPTPPHHQMLGQEAETQAIMPFINTYQQLIRCDLALPPSCSQPPSNPSLREHMKWACHGRRAHST